MSDKEPTLKNIAKEFFAPGYWNRALERKEQIKPGWWEYTFLVVGFAFIGLFCYLFFCLFFWLHVLLYPTDSGRAATLMSGELTLAQFLIVIMPFFSAIPLGFMASNALMWLVPPARRAAEKRAKGVKGASFREAQIGIFIMALFLVPIGLISGVIGAYLLGR